MRLLKSNCSSTLVATLALIPNSNLCIHFRFLTVLFSVFTRNYQFEWAQLLLLPLQKTSFLIYPLFCELLRSVCAALQFGLGLSFTFHVVLLLVHLNRWRFQNVGPLLEDAIHRVGRVPLLVSARSFDIVSDPVQRHRAVLLLKHVFNETATVLTLHALSSLHVHALDKRVVILILTHSFYLLV